MFTARHREVVDEVEVAARPTPRLATNASWSYPESGGAVHRRDEPVPRAEDDLAVREVRDDLPDAPALPGAGFVAAASP